MTAACTTTRYVTVVDAYRGEPAQIVSATARIAVLPNTAEPNPLFAQEVKQKLEWLLCERGLRIVPPDSADLHVFNVFGIGAPQTVSTGGVVLPLRNMLAFVPTSATTYYRWLAIGVKPALRSPESTLGGASLGWAWLSTAASEGSSGDLRQVIDFMMIATLQVFPSSTGRRTQIEMSDSDRRIKRLRARGAVSSDESISCRS